MSEQTSPILELQRQRMLLQMEYDAEKEAFQQQQQMQGMERLVARGDAWMPLNVGRSYYNSLNQLCVEVFRQNVAEDDEEAADHNFEFGRPGQFFKTHPQPLPAERGAVTATKAKGQKMAFPPLPIGRGWGWAYSSPAQ